MNETLEDFNDSIGYFLALKEELHLHKADALSNLDRRLADRASPPIRKTMKERYNRRERFNHHRRAGVIAPPLKHLSTHFRYR